MKKIKICFVFLLICMLSFFFDTKEVKAYIFTQSSPVVNTFTVQGMAQVTIKYTFVNLDGTTYSLQSDVVDDYFIGAEINLTSIQLSGVVCARIGNEINGSTYNSTTYTVQGATVIEQFYYQQVYDVTFHYNNGTLDSTRLGFYNQPLGTLPEPTREACATQGNDTYENRQCEYVYLIEGWYYDSGLTQLADATDLVTGDVDLYAKWNAVYYHYHLGGEIEFDGIDDILDSDVKLMSDENLNRDFDLTFTIVSQNSDYNYNSGKAQPTIMNAKDEGNSKYPGFVVRNNSGINAGGSASDYGKVWTKGRWSASGSGTNNYSHDMRDLAENETYTYEFKRRNGIVTCSVTSSTRGVRFSDDPVYDQSYWTLNQHSEETVTFGDAMKNDNPMGRNWKGKLANIKIKIYVEDEVLNQP